MNIDRILQISNDISEDMGSYTKAELVEVVRYWMRRHDAAINAHNSYRNQMIIRTLEVSKYAVCQDETPH